MRMLILLIAFPLFCHAQAPKKTNLIVIESHLSGEELYKESGLLLKSMGYQLEDTDKDFLTISTAFEGKKNRSYATTLNISVNDNFLEIRGYVINEVRFTSDLGSGLSSTRENRPERSSVRSLSTSIWRQGFNEMEAFADAFLHEYGGSKEYYIERD